jgi:hypothetical protein
MVEMKDVESSKRLSTFSAFTSIITSSMTESSMRNVNISELLPLCPSAAADMLTAEVGTRATCANDSGNRESMASEPMPPPEHEMRAKTSLKRKEPPLPVRRRPVVA